MQRDMVQLGIVSQETGDKLAEWLFNAGVAAGEMKAGGLVQVARLNKQTLASSQEE